MPAYLSSASVSRNFAWNPRLAHLRGLAAVLVLAFHTFHYFFGQWKPQSQAFGFGLVVEGHTGVSLFFVLSGFLFMSIAMQGDGHIDYGRFIRNRVLRIAPLFLVVFMVAISVGRDAFRPQDLLYVLFSNLGAAPTSSTFMTGAAWTISVEFTFYLVFPFLARFAMEQGPGYLLRLIGLLLLFKLGGFLATGHSTHMVYSTLLGRADQFLIGMLAALLAGRWLRKPLHGIWPVLAFVLIWGLVEMQARWASFFLPAQPYQWAWAIWPTVEALGWATVIVAYAHWQGQVPTRLGRWLEQGGEISFSIYLWHALVITLLGHAIGTPDWFADWRANAVVTGLLVFGLTFWVARLSYQTIEAPFLGMRKRYVP